MSRINVLVGGLTSNLQILNREDPGGGGALKYVKEGQRHFRKKSRWGENCWETSLGERKNQRSSKGGFSRCRLEGFRTVMYKGGGFAM